jgi:hypothetical protein
MIRGAGRAPDSAGESVKQSTGRNGQDGQESVSSSKKEQEPEPSLAVPVGAEERAIPGGDPPPEPAEVEGEVFAHCAYGQANYGETPSTDAKEDFAIVVLDKALAEVCPTATTIELAVLEATGPRSDCVQQVTMFSAFTSEAGVPYPNSLVGRRVRFKVSEYMTAITGHHHSRMLLWYSNVLDLGPATRRSLRPLWSRVKRDFLGVSCKGYPQ